MLNFIVLNLFLLVTLIERVFRSFGNIFFRMQLTEMFSWYKLTVNQKEEKGE